MGQILVPGTAQAVLQGTYASQPWAVVWHFKYDNTTANWSAANIQILADQLRNGWDSYAKPHAPTVVVLTQVTTTDIGSTSPTVGSNTNAVTGTGPANSQLNTATATLVNFLINVRYKGGHPRTYLPLGTALDIANEFSWTATYVGQSQAIMANIVSNVRANVPAQGGNQVSHVVPRYTYTYVDDPVHHKYLHQRSGLKSVDVVQSYLTNPTFGSQRRRLRL